MTKLLTALLAGAALTPCAALAQQSAPPPLPNVEVVAPAETVNPGSANAGAGTINYTPVPAAAIAADAAASPDTAAILGDVPGVSLRTGGPVSSLPVIHGFDDERNAILLGGMSITAACANHMNPALSYLGSTNVQSVEVYTANVPVSVGGDSIGGTIVVTPRAPVFAPAAGASASGLPMLAIAPGVVAGGSLTTMFRSNNKSTDLSGTAYVATEHFSLDYDGSWDRGDDYHAGGGAVVKSTNYDTENHALTLGYKNGDQLITLRGALQDIFYQGFPNERMDMLYNHQNSVNFDYKGGMGWGQLDVGAYYQHVQHYMNFLADKGGSTPTTGMPMYTDGQDFGYKLKATIAASKIDTVRIGNELHGQTYNEWWPPVAGMYPGMCCSTFENVHDATRDVLGTYAEWERKWTPQWTTLFGARNDTVWMNTGDVQGYSPTPGYPPSTMYSIDAGSFNAAKHAKTDVNFDFTALARYTPDDDATYEFGYTRKTRSPSIFERYAWSTGFMASSMVGWFGDMNGYVGNLNLKPEVANTVSATADWRGGDRDAWELKATPYFSYVQDYIDTTVIGQSLKSHNYVLQFTNHDAELYGFDLSGHVRLVESPTYGVFNLVGNVGYVRGINLDPSPDKFTTYPPGATSKNLYGMMPLNGKGALTQTLDLFGGKWTNSVELQAVAAKVEVDTERLEPRTPAYALTNLRSAYEIRNVRFDLGVENLFDKLYYLPLGGTDYADSVGKPPSEWQPVPGMGRTLYAGMTVKF
ncbi:MAG: TonB-dependent receptor [Roseiarcus sp.]